MTYSQIEINREPTLEGGQLSTSGESGRDPHGYARRAAVYHLECVGEEDHTFIERHILASARSALEIPAGCGRNNPVWRRHPEINVVLADLEPEMVRRLEERIRSDRKMDHVRTVQADMRQLTLERRFDLIVVPQEALQLLPDVHSVCLAVRSFEEHLSDRGVLLLDIAYLRADRRGLFPAYFSPELNDGIEILDWKKGLDDKACAIRFRTQYRVEGGVVFKLRYEIHRDGGIEDSWCASMRILDIPYDELISAVKNAGLYIEGSYSDYEMRPFSKDDTRCILVCRRHC